MKGKKIFLFIFGIVILCTAIWKSNLIESISKIEKVNLIFLIVCGLGINLILILKGIRWKYLFKKISFWEAMKIIGSSFFIASITPSRIGEISKVFFNKKKKKTLALFGIEYLGDLIAVLVLPAIFLAIYLNNIKYMIIITITIFLGIWLILFLMNHEIIDRIFLAIFPNKRIIIEHKKELAKMFEFYIKDKKNLSFSVFIGFLNYILLYIIGYFVFISLGIEISIISAITGLAIAQIVGVATFIPLGIGTRELSALGFFAIEGFDPGMIMNGLLIIRVITFIPIITGYLLYLLNIKK